MFRYRFRLIVCCVLFSLVVIMIPSLYDVELEGWGRNQSRNITNYMNNLQPILVPEKFCLLPTLLIVMVHSTASHFNARMKIRRTWAETSEQLTFNTSVYFLLGKKSTNIALQERINQEKDAFQDIIQINLEEHYNNLTLKSLAMLKTATDFCKKSTSFLLKCDDDTFVNLKELVKYLKVASGRDLLVGFRIESASPIRNYYNKWRIPYNLYPLPKFPDYIRGGAYLLTLDVATKLFSAAFNAQLIPLEDVFVTGLCAGIAQITLLHNPLFSEKECFNKNMYTIQTVGRLDRIYKYYKANYSDGIYNRLFSHCYS